MSQQGNMASPGWRRDLETAHAAIQVAIEVLEQGAEEAGDLRGPAAGIQTALARMYDALDDRADALESVLAAQRAFAAVADHIQSTLTDEGALSAAVRAAREAASSIDKVADELARLSVQRGAAPPRAAEQRQRIVASVGEPRLHHVQRASLVPKLRISSPPPPEPQQVLETIPAATSFEELESMGERIRGAVSNQLEQVMRARDEAAHDVGNTRPDRPLTEAVRWARELFEEVTMLGIHRAPLMGDDWRTMAHVEQRMLNAIDAFVAMGEPAARELERLVLDAPVRDPARVFALTLIAGCLSGFDALGMAERIARDGTVDPLAIDAFCSGLKLAPHPERLTLMSQLAKDDQPAFRAVAAEVAIHAGALDAIGLADLSGDRPEIARHALVPMAVSKHLDCERAIADALSSQHAGLRHAGWEALALLSRARATQAFQAAVDDERALLMWGVFGSSGDAGTLIERVSRAPSVVGAEALGFCGTPEAAHALMGMLLRDDDDFRRAAARALERITAAGLIVEIEVPPEKTVPRELPEPTVPGMAVAVLPTPLSDDPRFAPSEGSDDAMEHATLDPEHWRAWWREHGERFAAGQRYRHGVAHDERAVLAELDGPFATPAERRLLQLELASLTQTWVAFDVNDWVAVQERALDGWRQQVG